jgi:hypothetical protein
MVLEKASGLGQEKPGLACRLAVGVKRAPNVHIVRMIRLKSIEQ